MTALVLDSEALNLLAARRDSPGLRRVHAALTAAVAERVPVVTPAAGLAELYRGGGWDQRVDSTLGRHTGIQIRDTDRTLARLIGHILALARMGSEHHLDASAVATCLAAGGGLVLTADSEDLERLAAAAPGVEIGEA